MDTLTVFENDEFLEVSWFDSSDTLHSFIFLKNIKCGSYIRSPRDFRTITICF